MTPSTEDTHGAEAHTDQGDAVSPASPGWAAWWGVLGVSALFLSAAWRLGERGVETILAGLAPGEWVALAALTAAFVWGEGYRVLQRRYAPFAVERAARLDGSSPPAYRLLAPLYAMALVGASRGLLLKAWLGSLAIVGAVMVVRAFPDPWRGITDFAVASALLWGFVAVLVHARRSLLPGIS